MTYMLYAVGGAAAWLLTILFVARRARRLIDAATQSLKMQGTAPAAGAPAPTEPPARVCEACKRAVCEAMSVVVCRDCFSVERGHGYRAGGEWFMSGH